MESKIKKRFIQTNVKNMLLGVMAINYNLLMINLVSLLRYILVKIMFTILLVV